ncbi:hypothetical protein Goshw_011982 [Gossypium schwendimanii]|uniref:EamA domain-containing protein n=1 Tax=Gossypium schwendimanii TaxID=34291 RepID=A0A7J9MHR1_GOSSC|nr:hypothetical protein [Gossypium schwendimanii]
MLRQWYSSGRKMVGSGGSSVAKWYYYVVLGLVDVEANYLVVKAYQYTSITSVMLLDCWSIPSVMLLTFIFLKTKYRFRKIAGVIVCVAGLVMVIFSDVHAGDRSELPMWVVGGRDPRKGDLLVIAGATLYAISNVSEAFPFFGFSLAMFLFYSFVPVLLKMSGSTMLNLSLLTSDMWAVIIRIFAYHEKVDWMYFLAFAAVAVGLVIYSGGDKEEDQHQCIASVGDEDAGRSKCFDEEADFDNINRGAIAGSSKTGDTSKHDCITSGERSETIENRNIGKDVQGKKS